jgi:hypothetical protein
MSLNCIKNLQILNDFLNLEKNKKWKYAIIVFKKEDMKDKNKISTNEGEIKIKFQEDLVFKSKFAIFY